MGSSDDESDGQSDGQSDTVAVLERWTDAGAIWRVLSRTDDAVEISLRTCSGGEEVERIRSADPAVLTYLDGRWASDG